MEICGEIVKHKTFGMGQIIEVVNDYVTVLFDDSKIEKKFIYPTAFNSFLEVKNKSFFNQIEKDKSIIEKEAESIKMKEELEKVAVIIKTKVSAVKRVKTPKEPKPRFK